MQTDTGTPLTDEIQDANERYEGKIEIKRTDDRGWGLFALTDFHQGDLVMEACALSTSTKPCSHSVQTDHVTHVYMDLPARFVNHVCGVANLGVRDNLLGAYDFIALRAIRTGEELTWDYETTEHEVSEQFACSCGSPVCRKQLRGYKYHGKQVREAYGEEYIASYLRK